MSNQIRTRMAQKHDVQANWEKAVNFVPLAGEVIFYDPDETYSYTRMKVGDGETLVSALPFFITKVNTTEISHKDTNSILAQLIDTYILQIDYEKELGFNTSENIFAVTTTAILGTAILGSMKLGQE